VKICHFVASVGLGRGDAFVDLANVLSERAEIVVVAPYGSRFSSNLAKQVQLIEYRSRNSRLNPLLYLELSRLFRSLEADLVHTHFAKASEIFYRLNRVLRLPQVATKHNPRKGKIFQKLDHVIAVSEGVARSINHNRVKVIYNGIKPISVEPVEKSRVFTICAIGRLDKIKGFDLLIREVAKLDFDFLLQIAGEGEERGALEKLITDLNLAGKVELVGFREDIPELLTRADLQVMSSHSEGFSLAMVEAIYYSKVFISTRVSGCEEILDERLFVDGGRLSEKILEVYNRYAEYLAVFEGVKIRFKDQLHIDTVAAAYIDYYNKVLGNTGV